MTEVKPEEIIATQISRGSPFSRQAHKNALKCMYALKQAGYHITPIQPTEEQIDAAADVIRNMRSCYINTPRQIAKAVFTAGNKA